MEEFSCIKIHIADDLFLSVAQRKPCDTYIDSVRLELWNGDRTQRVTIDDPARDINPKLAHLGFNEYGTIWNLDTNDLLVLIVRLREIVTESRFCNPAAKRLLATT